MICSVNYGEILAKLSDHGVDLKDADHYVSSLQLAEIVFDNKQARLAASMRARTRSLGLSFADRACFACGFSQNLPVLTADRALQKADVGVKIILIR